MDKKFSNQTDRIILEVKTSRTGEETPEVMVQFLTSLVGLKKRFLLLWRKGIPFTLEIGVADQVIHFYISIPAKYRSFIESQLISQYPKAMITLVKDFIPDILANNQACVRQLKLSSSFLYPIRTFKDFKEVDPMSSLLGALSKAKPNVKAAVQLLLVPVNSSWQGKGERAIYVK